MLEWFVCLVLQGSIPYVPFLRAPYYVWVGHVPQLATVMTENKVEAPPMFPPTFLYTMSWEDPRPDMEVRTHCSLHSAGPFCERLESEKEFEDLTLNRNDMADHGMLARSSQCAGLQVLKINNDDTVLTLTSGGCNSLNLLLHGAGHVVSVDCNPAQSALLELKATGIRCGMHVSHVRSCCYPVYSCKR